MSGKNLKFSIFLLIRNSIYLLVGFLDVLIPKGKPKIVVYCYHSISDSGWRFTVTEAEFKKQIDHLLKNAIPLRSSELPAYMSGEKVLAQDAFVITFDDGYKDILVVKDFLKQNNIIPTAFVLSDTERANYNELETRQVFLNTNEIAELKAAGWDIGSHSATHADFVHLSPGEISAEVGGSKQALEAQLGGPIEYFAYPKGAYTSSVLAAVQQAGYTLAFSVNDGYVDTATNKFLIPRVGVDGTHTMKQFKNLALPFSMLARRIIKKII